MSARQTPSQSSVDGFPPNTENSDSFDIRSAFDPPLFHGHQASTQKNVKDTSRESMAASAFSANPLTAFLITSITESPQDAVCPLIVVRRTVTCGCACPAPAFSLCGIDTVAVRAPPKMTYGGDAEAPDRVDRDKASAAHPLAIPPMEDDKLRTPYANEDTRRTEREGIKSTSDSVSVASRARPARPATSPSIGSAGGEARAEVGSQSAPSSPACGPSCATDAVASIVRANKLVVDLLGYEDASSLIGRSFENMFCCYRANTTHDRSTLLAADDGVDYGVSFTSQSRRIGTSGSFGLISCASRDRQPSINFLTVPPPSLPDERFQPSVTAPSHGVSAGWSGKPQLLVPPERLSAERAILPARAAQEDGSASLVPGLQQNEDPTNKETSPTATGAVGHDEKRTSPHASNNGGHAPPLAEIHSVDDLFESTAIQSVIAYSLATGRYYSAFSLCKSVEIPAVGGRVQVEQQLFLCFLSQIASGSEPAAVNLPTVPSSDGRGSDAPTQARGLRTTLPSPCLLHTASSAAAAAAGAAYTQPTSPSQNSPLNAPVNAGAVTSSPAFSPHGPARRWWTSVRTDERPRVSPRPHTRQPLLRSPSTDTSLSYDYSNHTVSSNRSPEDYPLTVRNQVDAALDAGSAYARVNPTSFGAAANQFAPLPEFGSPQAVAPAKSLTSTGLRTLSGRHTTTSVISPFASTSPSVAGGPSAATALTGFATSNTTGPVCRAVQTRALAVDELTTDSLRSKMMYMNGVRHVTMAEDVPHVFLTNFVILAMLTQATLRKLREMGFKDMCCFINVFKRAYLAIDFILPSEIKFLRKKLGSTRAARESTLHSLQRVYRVLEARQTLHHAITTQQQQQQLQQPTPEMMRTSSADTFHLFDEAVGDASELAAAAQGIKPVVAARPITEEDQQSVPLATFLTEDLIEQLVANDADVRLSVGNGASIRFPFITKERLALLSDNPQVQLSAAKGLTMFGVAGANALTEQAVADADAPAPKIVPLRYDRAAEDYARFQASLGSRHADVSDTSRTPSTSARPGVNSSAEDVSSYFTISSRSRISNSYGLQTISSPTGASTSVKLPAPAQLAGADASTAAVEAPLVVETAALHASHVASEHIRPTRVTLASATSLRAHAAGATDATRGVCGRESTTGAQDTRRPSADSLGDTDAQDKRSVGDASALPPPQVVPDSPADDMDFFSPSPQYASSISSEATEESGEEANAEISRVSSVSALEEKDPTQQQAHTKDRHPSAQRTADGAMDQDQPPSFPSRSAATTDAVAAVGERQGNGNVRVMSKSRWENDNGSSESLWLSLPVSSSPGEATMSGAATLPLVLENAPSPIRPSTSSGVLDGPRKRRVGSSSSVSASSGSFNAMSVHCVPSSESLPLAHSPLNTMAATGRTQTTTGMHRPDTALPSSFIDDSKPLPNFVPVTSVATGSGEVGSDFGLLSSLTYTATMTSIPSHDFINTSSASSIPIGRAMASTQADSDGFPMYSRDTSSPLPGGGTTPILGASVPAKGSPVSTTTPQHQLTPIRRRTSLGHAVGRSGVSTGRHAVVTTTSGSRVTIVGVPNSPSPVSKTVNTTQSMSVHSNADTTVGTLSSSKIIPLFGGFRPNNQTADLLVRLSTAIPNEDNKGMTEVSSSEDAPFFTQGARQTSHLPSSVSADSPLPQPPQSRHDVPQQPQAQSVPRISDGVVQLPHALLISEHANGSTVAGVTITNPTTTNSGNGTLLCSSYSPAGNRVDLPSVRPTTYSPMDPAKGHVVVNKQARAAGPALRSAARATAAVAAARHATGTSGSGSQPQSHLVMDSSMVGALASQTNHNNDSFAVDSRFDMFGSASRTGDITESAREPSKTLSSNATSIARRRLHIVVYNTEERDEIDETLGCYGHSVLFVTKPAKIERFLRAGMTPFDVLIVEWCAALITPEVHSLLLSRALSETVVLIHVTIHPNGQYGDLPLPKSDLLPEDAVVCSPDIAATVLGTVVLERTRGFIRQKRLLKDLLDVRLRHSYQIVRQIGSGAFGDVFEVLMYVSRGRLAMKRIFLKNVKVSVLEQLYREVMIMSALDHPNIISFSHTRLEENTYSIFMELGDGTLAQRLREPVETAGFARKPSMGSRTPSGVTDDPFASLGFQPGVVRQSFAGAMGNAATTAAAARQTGLEGGGGTGAVGAGALLSPREAILIIHDVCSGLAYLHHRDIIHRDIKPENVLFAAGVAKLGDFGSATRVTEKLRLTNMRGTLSYMSPEVMLGEQYSKPCDIWSMGCLIADIIGLSLGHFSGLHVPAMVELYRSLTEADALPITITKRVTSTCMENHYADQVTQSVVTALKEAASTGKMERTRSRRHMGYSPPANDNESVMASVAHTSELWRTRGNTAAIGTPQPSLAQFESADPSEAASSQGSYQRGGNCAVGQRHAKTTATTTTSPQRALLTLLPTSQDPSLHTSSADHAGAAAGAPLQGESANLSSNTTITNSCYSDHHDDWQSAGGVKGERGADASTLGPWLPRALRAEAVGAPTSTVTVHDAHVAIDSHDHGHSSHRGSLRSRTVTCITTSSVAVLGTHTVQLPASLVELFEGIFCRDPDRRMTIDDILNHPVTWDVEWMVMVRAELQKVMAAWPDYRQETGADNDHADDNLLSLTFSSSVNEDSDD